MEHSAPVLGSARTWRTATLVAGGVAAIELVAILVLGILLLGRPLSHQVRQAAATRALVPKARPRVPPRPLQPPSLPRRRTSVLVLNGNGRAGAAADAAAEVRGRGYRLAGVGNASRSDYASTMVMYRRGFRAEAARLARDQHVGAVGPLDGVAAGKLGRAQVVLILGT